MSYCYRAPSGFGRAILRLPAPLTIGITPPVILTCFGERNALHFPTYMESCLLPFTFSFHPQLNPSILLDCRSDSADLNCSIRPTPFLSTCSNPNSFTYQTVKMPIDHTSLPVQNLEASKAFYTEVLKPLTYGIFMEFPGNALGFAPKGGRSDCT